MRKTTFEWDEEKDKENQEKHKVSFIKAQQAFLDPQRVIVEEIWLTVPKKTDTTASDGSVMVL